MSDGVHVLDASALLALVQGTPGAERIDAVIERSIISAAGLAEVISHLVGRGFGGSEVLSDLREVGIEVVPFDQAQAEGAGLLRSLEEGERLSLGERMCLALGQVRGLPVITSSHRQATLGRAAGIAVELIQAEAVPNTRGLERSGDVRSRPGAEA